MYHFLSALYQLVELKKQLLNLVNSLDKNKFRIDLFILMNEKGELFNELNSSINVYLPKFKFKSKINIS